MAISRYRTVKPRFFQEEDLLALPVEVRMTFLGLQMYADDFGNESTNTVLLRAALWPMEKSITDETIDAHLIMLADAGYVDLYTVGKRTYYSVNDWLGWQRVDKPTASNIPVPPPREPLATASRAAPEPFAVEGRERVRAERERGSAPRKEGEGGSSLPSRDRPSPFCKSHPDGTDRPCRACGTARLRHKVWMEDLIDSGDMAAEMDPNDD